MAKSSDIYPISKKKHNVVITTTVHFSSKCDNDIHNQVHTHACQIGVKKTKMFVRKCKKVRIDAVQLAIRIAQHCFIVHKSKKQNSKHHWQQRLRFNQAY